MERIFLSCQKTVVPSNAGLLLGPRLTIIRPGNVIILERGPRQSRISGPAIFYTNLFEYVKRIYHLQEKQETFTFDDVLTGDSFGTTVRLTVTYGIDISDAAKRGERPLTPEEIARIQYIDTRMPDWERSLKSAIEAGVRQAVMSLSLINLMVPPGRLADLDHQILDLTNRKINPWGIRIDEVTVQSVQPVREIISEGAKAEAWRRAMLLLADGYRNAIRAGMPGEIIHQEVARLTLEHIAKDPATRIIFTPELNQTLANPRLFTDFDQ